MRYQFTLLLFNRNFSVLFALDNISYLILVQFCLFIRDKNKQNTLIARTECWTSVLFQIGLRKCINAIRCLGNAMACVADLHRNKY